MSLAPNSNLRLEHAELTDLGMRRGTNQDAVTAVVNSHGPAKRRGDVFMVADGMGAHAAGELASKMAVDCIPHAYLKSTDLAPQAALRQAVRKANGLIHQKGQSSPEFQGMGTTCSCLLLLPNAALVAHVGDSRVYRLRDGKLEQLTFDHSLVWELAAASHTSADEVPACIPKNVITRSLGPHDRVNVDLEGPYRLAEGDVFLICSDGLTAVVSDEIIGAVIGAMPANDAVQTLVDIANLRGGPDNVSVIVTRIRWDGAPDSAEPDDETTHPDRSDDGQIGTGAWLALVATLAALVWFGSKEDYAWGLVALVGFAAALIYAISRHQKNAETAGPAALGGPYGDGPYRTIECRPGKEAIAAIREVVGELAKLESREPDESSPPIGSWSDFEDMRKQGEAAAGAGDTDAAIRHFSAAIRSLTQQARDRSTTVEYSPETDES